MKTGNLNGTIYGNEWQTVYDSGELTSAQTSIVISGLNGDIDKEYRLILRIVNGYSSTCRYLVFANNDTSASNYGFQVLYGQDFGYAAARVTSNAGGLNTQSGASFGYLYFKDAIIYAKSGYLRTSLSSCMPNITGTNIDSVEKAGIVWSNTIDNITSLTITGDNYTSNVAAIGVGSRIILMRRADNIVSAVGKTGNINCYGRMTGCFQKIYSNILTSSVTSITISNLDGNKDNIYLLKCRFKVASDVTTNLKFNNDSGANYGYQYIYSASNVAAAGKGVVSSLYLNGLASGNKGLIDAIIYAKSGYTRTILYNREDDVTGTTVGSYVNFGWTWNNISDNITSLIIGTFEGTSGALDAGTLIELFAYRP